MNKREREITAARIAPMSETAKAIKLVKGLAMEAEKQFPPGLKGLRAKAEVLQGAHAIAWLVWQNDYALHNHGGVYWSEQGLQDVTGFAANVLKIRGGMHCRRVLIDMARIADQLANGEGNGERLRDELDFLDEEWDADRAVMFRGVARHLTQNFLPASAGGEA